MKNILLLSPIIPFPLKDGGRICIFGFIDFLRTEYHFTLLLKTVSKTDSDNINKLRGLWNNVDLIEVKQYGIRKRSLLSKIKSKFINLLDTPSINKYNFSQYIDIQDVSFISALEHLLNQHHYDIIQVLFTVNLNLIEILPKSSKIVFEQIESKYMILNDYLNLEKDLSELYKSYVVKNMRLMEYSYLSKYDAIFTLNSIEKEEISKELAMENVFYSPFGIFDNEISTKYFDYFDKLVFIGGENHFPNFDGLNWFVNEVFNKPCMNKYQLVVTGNWSKNKRDYFNRLNKNIIFTGFVENIEEIISNSIMISPIRLGGGGLRTKIIFAMANNIPVISTEIGAFGINYIIDENLVIANTANEFENAIIKIMTDANFGQSLTKKASSLVKREYSQSSCSIKRKAFYEKILEIKK